MLKNNQQNLPPAATKFIDDAGALTSIGRQFLQSLWGRTGEGPGISDQVATALSATGSSADDSLQLGVDWNEVTTTAAGSGVKLRVLKQGQTQFVFNGGVNALEVYPPDGARINALAIDSPYSLPAGATQYFNCFSEAQYRTVTLG